MWSSSFLCLATICPLSFAISLLDSIANTPELSSLNSYIKKFPTLEHTLDQADKYTFLAPSNTVLDQFVNETLSDPSGTLDDVEATLMYHLLQGTFADTDFSTTPAFPATHLTNSSYTNVTGGQHVQIALNNGSAEIESYNKARSLISTADIISAGGLMHIIESVLVVPKSLIDLASQAQFKFFVTILTKGNFLTQNSDSFSTQVLGMTDITGFVPDSQGALDSFLNLTKTSSQAELNDIFKYHLTQGVVVYSDSLTDKRQIKTLQGSNLTIFVGPDGTKYVNGLKIIATDYSISNGVIHLVDGTLDPKNITTPNFSDSSGGDTSTQSSSSKHLSPGAKAGIALSVIILAGIILAIALFFLRRRRNQKNSNSHPPPSELDGSMSPTTRHLAVNDGSRGYDWEQQSKNSASELHGEPAGRTAFAMRPLMKYPGGRKDYGIDGGVVDVEVGGDDNRRRNSKTREVVHVDEYIPTSQPIYAVELEAARVRSPERGPGVKGVRGGDITVTGSPVTPVSPPT